MPTAKRRADAEGGSAWVRYQLRYQWTASRSTAVVEQHLIIVLYVPATANLSHRSYEQEASGKDEREALCYFVE